MDKNSLIGLGLIAVILIGWLALSGPNEAQIKRNKAIKDSIELALKQTEIKEAKKALQLKRSQDSLKALAPEITDSLKNIALNSSYKDFAISANGKAELVTIENEKIKAYISTKGGYVQKVELKEYQRSGQTKPLILFEKSDSTFQNIQFKAYNNITLSTDSFYFKPSANSVTVNGSNTQAITLKLETSLPNSYIEYTYTLKGNDYLLGYDVKLEGMQTIIPAATKNLSLLWSQELPSQEKHISKEREAATVYYNLKEDGVDYTNPRRLEETVLNEFDTKWVCFKQQFFNSTLIAKTEFSKEGTWVKMSENAADSNIVKTISSQLAIPYSHKSSEVFAMQYYFGPTHYNTLKQYDDLKLKEIIPTGFSVFSYINKWMVIPLLNAFSSMNMGIVILILTLILKTLLFPIAYKTYMSSSKMRLLKPEIDALNAKFPEGSDPMKKQQESMALYRRAGASPLAGCVPMLLQFPILIALFAFIPAAIELRGKPFLWAEDLSTYDSVYNFGFHIPGFGDHFSLFAMLMFVSTIIYTWMNQAMLQPAQTQQMPGMKYMMYLMPVIFLAVMNSYAAGLSWYYFLANIITFLQTFLMRKFVDDKKIRAELEANMQKPEKKSSFQQRLEEMAKQRNTPIKKN